jgi:hypothetical protein
MRCANSRDFADRYGGIEHQFGPMHVLTNQATTSPGCVAIMKCAAVSIVASVALLMHSLSSALARYTAG